MLYIFEEARHIANNEKGRMNEETIKDKLITEMICLSNSSMLYVKIDHLVNKI